MKHLALVLFPLLGLAAEPGSREHTIELLATEALAKRDPEARLLVCNTDKLITDGVFTCYSANLGPSAVCDDGSRSAPFWVIEGYLDVELQPQIGRLLYSEACEGVVR